MDFSKAVVALTFVGLAGCAGTLVEAEEGDPNESFLTAVDGKADNFGISDGTPRAIAALNVANTFDVRVLTELVGLPSRVATGIEERRLGPDQESGTADDVPFKTLAELDTVPWLGPAAFNKILNHVDSHDLAESPTVYGWPEGGQVARRILDLANGVHHQWVFFESERTIETLFEYRTRYGALTSLHQLSRMPGIDAGMFQQLWAWAERMDVERRPVSRRYDRNDPDNPFDPNLCAGKPMSEDYAATLLGDDDEFLLSDGFMAHDIGVVGDPGGASKFGERLPQQLWIRRGTDGAPYLSGEYLSVTNQWRRWRCDFGEECTMRVTPHCAVVPVQGHGIHRDYMFFHIGGALPVEQTTEATVVGGATGATSSLDDDHILTTANSLTLTQLADHVGLSSAAAANIVLARSGADGVDGSADDELFQSVDELDAVPQVGPATLRKLLVYGRVHDLRSGRGGGSVTDLSGAEMPYSGDWDPMSCTGERLSSSEAEALLDGRPHLTATAYERIHTSCTQESCDVIENSAPARLEPDRLSNGEFVLTAHTPYATRDRVTVRFNIDGYVSQSGWNTTPNHPQTWYYEFRETCLKFWKPRQGVSESVVVFRLP